MDRSDDHQQAQQQPESSSLPSTQQLDASTSSSNPSGSGTNTIAETRKSVEQTSNTSALASSATSQPPSVAQASVQAPSEQGHPQRAPVDSQRSISNQPSPPISRDSKPTDHSDVSKADASSSIQRSGSSGPSSGAANMTASTSALKDAETTRTSFSAATNGIRSSPSRPSRDESPSKGSATSEEEGMIREEEDGEIIEDAYQATPSSQAALPRSTPSRPSLSERLSSAPTPARASRWSIPEPRPPPPASSSYSSARDTSRSDSYHPARDRERDRERERARDRERDLERGRERATTIASRFPMTRPYEEPPPPPTPATARLPRGGDSYRPSGGAALPSSSSASSRPRMTPRTSSGGSANDSNRGGRRGRESPSPSSDRWSDGHQRREEPPSPMSSLDRPPLSATLPSHRDKADRWSAASATSSPIPAMRPWGSSQPPQDQYSSAPPSRWSRWGTAAGGRDEEDSRRSYSRSSEGPLADQDRMRQESLSRDRPDLPVHPRQASIELPHARRSSPEPSRSPGFAARRYSYSTDDELARSSARPGPTSPSQSKTAKAPTWNKPSFEPPRRDTGWGPKARRESSTNLLTEEEALPQSEQPGLSKEAVSLLERFQPQEPQGIVRSHTREPLLASPRDSIVKREAVEESAETKDATKDTDSMRPALVDESEARLELASTVEKAQLPSNPVTSEQNEMDLDPELTPQPVAKGSILPSAPMLNDEQQIAETPSVSLVSADAAMPLAEPTSVVETSVDLPMSPAQPSSVEVKPEPVETSKSPDDRELDAVMKDAAAVAGVVGAAKDETAAAEAADITMDEQQETVDSRADTEEQDDLPPEKSQEEIDIVRRAALRRVLKTKTFDTDVTLEKMFAQNRRLAETTTLSYLESAIHGPPAQVEAVIDIYEETSESKRVQSILTDRLMASNKRLYAKTERLKQQYKQLNSNWQAHCARLDRAAEQRENARKAAAPVGTPGASSHQASLPEEASLGITSTPAMMPTMSGRANRRGAQSSFGFGDAVRSEAEFLEILASLETADMQDPEARAARTATTVPDQLINPDRDALLKSEVDDLNGFVADPIAFYLDEFDPDYWSQEEKVIFARKYAIWPKQFGKIASALPNKTANQCVYYYYLTKHQIGHDYKAITAARNRNQKRKGKIIKPKKGRGSALLADLKSAKGDEMGDDEDPGSPSDAGPSSRSRLLSGPDGAALQPLMEEDESFNGDVAATTSPSSSKKRKPGDDLTASVDGNAGEKRPKTGRGGKRVKGQGKGRNAASSLSITTPLDSPSAESPVASVDFSQAGDLDLAAAEALGALSGMLPPSSVDAVPAPKGKKKKSVLLGPATEAGVGPSPVTGEEGGSAPRKARQATSSYWSIQERAHFLLGCAVHGKDWDAIANNIPNKSAAQARNFFTRSIAVPDFVETVKFYEEHASEDSSTREQHAGLFIRQRLGITDEMLKGTAGPTSRSGPSSTLASKEASPEAEAAPRRAPGGMGIMSLLNDVSSNDAPARKPLLRDWFGDAPGNRAAAARQDPSSEDRLYSSGARDEDDDSTDNEDPYAQPSQAAAPRPPYRYSEQRSYAPEVKSYGSSTNQPPATSAYGSAAAAPPPPPPLPRLSVSSRDEASGITQSRSPYGDYSGYSHSPASYSDSRGQKQQLSPLPPLGGRSERGGDDAAYSHSRHPQAYDRPTSSSSASSNASAYFDSRSNTSNMGPPSSSLQQNHRLSPLGLPSLSHGSSHRPGSWGPSTSATSSLRESDYRRTSGGSQGTPSYQTSGTASGNSSSHFLSASTLSRPYSSSGIGSGRASSTSPYALSHSTQQQAGYPPSAASPSSSSYPLPPLPPRPSSSSGASIGAERGALPPPPLPPSSTRDYGRTDQEGAGSERRGEEWRR